MARKGEGPQRHRRLGLPQLRRLPQHRLDGGDVREQRLPQAQPLGQRIVGRHEIPHVVLLRQQPGRRGADRHRAVPTAHQRLVAGHQVAGDRHQAVGLRGHARTERFLGSLGLHVARHAGHLPLLRREIRLDGELRAELLIAQQPLLHQPLRRRGEEPLRQRRDLRQRQAPLPHQVQRLVQLCAVELRTQVLRQDLQRLLVLEERLGLPLRRPIQTGPDADRQGHLPVDLPEQFLVGLHLRRKARPHGSRGIRSHVQQHVEPESQKDRLRAGQTRGIRHGDHRDEHRRYAERFRYGLVLRPSDLCLRQPLSPRNEPPLRRFVALRPQVALGPVPLGIGRMAHLAGGFHAGFGHRQPQAARLVGQAGQPLDRQLRVSGDLRLGLPLLVRRQAVAGHRGFAFEQPAGVGDHHVDQRRTGAGRTAQPPHLRNGLL